METALYRMCLIFFFSIHIQRCLPEPAEFKAEHVSTHQLVNISNSIVVKTPSKFLLWSMVFWTNHKTSKRRHWE